MASVDPRMRVLCAFCPIENVCPVLKDQAISERDRFLRSNNKVEVVFEDSIHFDPDDANPAEMLARTAVVHCLEGKDREQCTIKGIVEKVEIT